MDSAHVSRHVSAQQGDGRAPHRQAAFTERRKMRLIPLLTALLVTVVLYLAVFQRDAMLAFALGEAGAQQPETETGGADGVATVPAATDAVRVVVLRSQARTVDSAVIVRGQTQAARQVEVRAETAGTVISEPLRKGASVAAAIPAVHLSPKIYPEPYEFRPERFLDGKPKPYEYLPFGGGNRRCIGAAFSLFESRVALATGLREFEFELLDAEVPAIERRSVTLGPAGGVRLRMVGRRRA